MEEDIKHLQTTSIFARVSDVTDILDSEDFDTILDQKSDEIIFSVEKVPGTCSDVIFFLIDQSSGLGLVDAVKGKYYVLTSEQSFTKCRTLSIALLDKQGKDPTKGFRVLKIDQYASFKPVIKVYDFDEEYIQNLI